MGKKIRVGVLFGGRSAEHEVALQSAKNVIDAIDKNKYEIVLIGIDKSGRWHLQDQSRYLLNAENPKLIQLNESNRDVGLVPGNDSQLVSLGNQNPIDALDVVFPVLHGSNGEDGTVQGMLKLANIPFVGASVLGSAVAMDKDVTKRLLRDAGIPITDFLVFTDMNKALAAYSEITAAVGEPFFLKPANAGSSVGVHKVKSKAQFESAVRDAFQFDTKILCEEFANGREIECSVLGNENPIASIPGEIIAKHEFYSYEAKYIDEQGAALEIPAQISADTAKLAQELAIKTFQVLCCEGMARVDFFLRKDGSLLVNEVNTIPGFTRISMYPKLWEASGISYVELVDRLIQLALDRHARNNKLKLSYEA